MCVCVREREEERVKDGERETERDREKKENKYLKIFYKNFLFSGQRVPRFRRLGRPEDADQEEGRLGSQDQRAEVI